MSKLMDHLSNSLLTGDGAMATFLYQKGISIGQSLEELVIKNPVIVAQAHRQYYEAGARLIETNTFGANRERLSRYGLETKVARINYEAVKLARSSVGSDAYVLGAIGSICGGRVLDMDEAEYTDMYQEQAIALLQGGIDGLILETFLDLKEIEVAIKAIQQLSDLPIFAHLSMMETCQTRDGYNISEAFSKLECLNIAGVGLNCRQGPVEILRTLESSIVPESLILSVFPNAGRLGVSDGEIIYSSSPEYFAEIAPLFIKQGVKIFGGCCGTTPEHIREIHQALKSLKPVPRINPTPMRLEIDTPDELKIEAQKPTLLEQVEQEHTVICELDTPKDLDLSKFLVGAEKLAEAGAAYITMADNALATTRMSNIAVGAILKSNYNIESLVHIACRDRNMLGQQSHLMGLHALGINHILVITGDPARIGDLPGASSVYDLNSFELIRMVKQLNTGISFSGRKLKQQANFIVGAAFNPHVKQLDKAVARLEKKIAAGADFIMTQPVYDEAGILGIYNATSHLEVPIFIGIMPITNYRNALFLHNEVPGIKIPEHILKTMETITDPELARETGVTLAQDLLEVAMTKFKGIYLITPFMHWPMSVKLTQFIEEKKTSKSII